MPLAAAAPARSAPAADLSTDTFLADVARHLLAAYGADDAISDLTVVVPTRRAVVYLQNELARALPPGEALWSPRIAAMEDYMVERAGVQLEEPIALQLLLYDVFREIDQDLAFDQFATWGGLLLQDFSTLDQYLADSKGLFEYLAEAKALERWNLEPGQKTTGLDRYFGFWGQLHKVYLRFKKQLNARHLAYPGLAYRRAVQRLRRELADPRQPLPPPHVFVGLGNLSKAEETFITLLRKVNRAEVLFDADPFYLDNAGVNRAGLALHPHFKRWNLPRHDTFTVQEHLRARPRHVRLLGVANASLQGKLAGQLVAEARARNPHASVAVVLPDETLLLPVLYGLPGPELLPEFNVTMGLSFQSTALFNLVDLLFEVHLTGVREGAAGPDFGVVRYHHLAVTKLLSHPFLRRYQRWLDAQADQPQFHGLLSGICDELVRRHLVLLPAAELLRLGHGHPLVAALFATWHESADIIRACHALVRLLRQVYEHEATLPSPHVEDQLGAEYLYLFYTLVRQLEAAFEGPGPRLSVRAFRRFLYEQMRRTRLPFQGQPLAQVQVMGLLETRALDFDHVIVLSCNENVLPAPKRQASLFPYDVLTQFRLPTYAQAEATTAYNFWRLLHRARRADLLHVLPGAEGARTGERSRFLRQLQLDLAVQNAAMVVEDRVVAPAGVASPPRPPSPGERGEPSASLTSSFRGSPLSPGEGGRGGEAPRANDLTLAKDPEMLAALRALLQNGLSPSALNDYLACSLRFYFARLAKFKENEAVEEELGTDGFGTVVHDALEFLLQPFTERPLTADELPALLAQVPAEVRRQLRQEEQERQARPDDGLNHVLGQVAVRLIRKYLESLPAQGELPLRLWGLEKSLGTTVFVDELPGGGPPLALRLIGRADRVDELPDGRRRVVDYKTGLVHARELNLRGTRPARSPQEAAELLLTDSSAGADKVRQLWLYRFLLETSDVNPAPPGSDAAILSLRNIDEGLLAAPLDWLPAATGQPDFRQASEALIRQLVRRLLDPTEPIRKTDDLAKCEYCPYVGICAR